MDIKADCAGSIGSSLECSTHPSSPPNKETSSAADILSAGVGNADQPVADRGQTIGVVHPDLKWRPHAVLPRICTLKKHSSVAAFLACSWQKSSSTRSRRVNGGTAAGVAALRLGHRDRIRCPAVAPPRATLHTKLRFIVVGMLTRRLATLDRCISTRWGL